MSVNETCQDAQSGAQDVVIIGLGNLYRHDDAVGLVIAERLKAETVGAVTVLTESGEGTALMDAWEGADSVILCDAVFSGAGPGTIFRFDVGSQPIPRAFFRFSTHDFGVAEAIEMARALNRLPPHVIVYGIEGANFEQGAGLSSELGEAVEDVVHHILARHDIQTQMGRQAVSSKQ